MSIFLYSCVCDVETCLRVQPDVTSMSKILTGLDSSFDAEYDDLTMMGVENASSNVVAEFATIIVITKYRCLFTSSS